MLVAAAWSAAKSPGSLRAFAQRTAARRGRHVATVAVARKLAVIAWHLLTRGQDYAFQRPSLVRRKIRCLELAAGAPRAKPGPNPDPVWHSTTYAAEKRLATQAEAAYRRLISDWQATPKRGCGSDTGARISKAVEGQGPAADHKLLTSALRHVSHQHPTAASHKEPQRATRFDFHP